MKKVLHILSSKIFSGAENVACQIIDMFENEEYNMAYCSPDGAIRDVLKDNNIEYFPISKMNIKELRRVINQYNPDIIHAHDTMASVMSFLLAGNRQVISHMHVNHENMNKLNFKTLTYLITTIKYKYILWVSESAYENYKFKKLITRKSKILYNVISYKSLITRKKLDPNTYDFDIVYVGRFVYQKNPERLLRIINEVIQKKPHIKVGIVGSGELEDKLIRIAEKEGIIKNISFLGFRKNPLKIMENSKVMVMTSRYEGTPMCVLEAMALGVPIVSTPTDGIKELIEDGVNGFLSDSDDVIVEKISNIIQDEKLRFELSQNSIKRFKELNNEKLYKQFIKDIYMKEMI